MRTYKYFIVRTILSIFLIMLLAACSTPKKEELSVIIDTIDFKYAELKGLEPENGVCRRDPSDVIKVDGIYYVWYTKTEKQYSGYDASIWFATSKDGETWTEKGEALQRGARGAWDEFSVFTPNILVAKGKYYLYYTGVKPTPGNKERIFENNSENDFTAIGLAVSNVPDGPFERTSSEPVLKVSDDATEFDSYRVDDACLIYRNEKYLLYYKGRSLQYGDQGPRHTKLGVAMADRPEGPYLKQSNNPIITSGHEVMVWPYQKGLMALLSDHGPEGKSLQYSSDGVTFKKVGEFGNDYPKAPGSFRSGHFSDASDQEKGIDWGISMYYGDKDQWPYLLRYEIQLQASKNQE